MPFPLGGNAEFDTIDLLFVNAGFSTQAPLANVTEAIYDEMFNLNATGPLFAVQKFAPLINRGGSVVLTTSVANVKGLSLYSKQEARSPRRPNKPEEYSSGRFRRVECSLIEEIKT